MPRVHYHPHAAEKPLLLNGEINVPGTILTVRVLYRQDSNGNLVMPADAVDGKAGSSIFGDVLAPRLEGMIFHERGSIDLNFADAAKARRGLHMLVVEYDGTPRSWLSADDVTVDNGFPSNIVNMFTYADRGNAKERDDRARYPVIGQHLGAFIMLRVRTKTRPWDATPIRNFHEAQFRLGADSKGAVGHFYRHAFDWAWDRLPP